MKRPYFQERSLPARVEKYMSDNKHVDLEEMTDHLMNNYREFRLKNKKAFMKSVEKAYEWQLYCRQLDQDSGEDIEDSDGGGPDILEITEPDPLPRGRNTNAMLNKMYKSASANSSPRPKSKNDFFVLDVDGNSSFNGTRTPDASARKKRKKKEEKDGDIEDLIKRKKKKQLMAEASTVTLADMAGIEALEEQICDLAGNLRWPGVLQPLIKSALVTGPSGSGKTTFGQALAGTSEAPVVRVTATELVGGVSGESEERITEVFEQAAALSPCVLLLEKLDVVAPKDSNATKGLERRICTQLASCLASLKAKHKDKQVLVLGETSRPEKLDWDLRGSFDLEVFMAIPTEEARGKILKLLCAGCVVDSSVGGSFEEIAYRTPGYVAGDLRKLVEKAQSLAWKRKKVSLRDGTTGGCLEERVKDFLGHLGRMCEAEEQKVTVTVTMEDFMEALLHITPALKREGFPTVPDITWQDIGGLEDIKRELREKILEPIKFAKLHEELGLSRPNGVLMWGPPGCGKTLLAKAVANEAGVNLLPVMGPELLNMYQGESERAVREVFYRARNVAPCVIFFDEFDSLCPVRSKGEQGGSKTTIVNTLLTEMNGFAKREDVYVIAATNRPDILDPAVTRPGRFDTLLYVDVPDYEGRVSIFKARTKNGTCPALASDVKLEEVSKLCDNFSGADCDQLVYLAGKELIREVIHATSSSSATPSPAQPPDESVERRLVARRHFSAALRKMKPSISAEEQRRYKKLHSKMEAGRVQGSLQGFPEDAPPLVQPPQDDAQPMEVADDKDTPATDSMERGGSVVRVQGQNGGPHPSLSGGHMVVQSSRPPWLRLLQKWGLQLLILAVVVVVAVVVPVVVSLSKNSEVPADRISCHRATKEQCEEIGCLWDAWGEDVPSCYFPPASLHGYSVTTLRNNTSGRMVAHLTLKNTSARVVPNLKEALTVEVTQYSGEVLRVKVTVPGAKRFEPPVPLQLPDPPEQRQEQQQSLYNVTLGEEGGDFRLVVRRRGSDAVLFDTGVGGFTFADQYLQVATRLASRNLYGLGESHHQSLRHDLHYRTWPMFARDQPPGPPGENLYGVHPVYMVLEGTGEAHMVLWLNSNAMEAETMPLPGLNLRAIGGVVDLYFFLGPTPTQALQQYTATIGRPALPPYWALGFQLCRYGYNTLDNLKAAVSRTRRHGIPQDVQYGDIDHMDHRLDFTVDRVNFAGLEDYVREVKREGLRFIIILDPAINAEMGEEYLVHKRARDKDVYITWPPHLVPQHNFGAGDVMLGYVWPDNRTAFPDFFRSSTKAWWKEEIRLLYAAQGLQFDGLWIDMNEPANFGTNEEQPWNWPEGRQPWSLTCPNTTLEDPPYLPAAVTVWGPGKRLSDKTICMEAQQGEQREFTHYDVHNLYGWSQAQPTLEALQAVTGKRGIVVSRSTFPSSGRWAGHWLGDNSARWSDMHKSIIGMMEFNLFGIPYIGADICGFFGDTSEEMCGRWMEVGAFYPYSRNHNTLGAADHDPGLWPSVAAAGRAALTIRYTLLPYLYTLHHLAATQGHSVIRPLFFEFPDTSASWGVDDQFLWGPWLMVAPVLDQGVVARDVYFPPATWYDYHTGQAVEGTDTTQQVDAPLGHVPLYVRGGGIMVTQRPHANTMMSRSEPLGLVVAPDGDGAAQGFFYWDDGEAIDPVGSGQYFTAEITYTEGSVVWAVVHSSLPETAQLVMSDVTVFSVAVRPAQLLVDGKRWTTGDWHYDANTQTLKTFDLALSITTNFNLSWSNTATILLPCPVSYQGRQDGSHITKEQCRARNCVWDQESQVQCSIPPPDQYGLEFVDGHITATATGFKTLLRPRGAALYPGGPEEVIFEAFQYTNFMLRVKFYASGETRYEVPVPLDLSQEEVDDPLYRLVLPDDPAPGKLFFFYVIRADSGTVLFDTRIGGLTFTEQFLSISTALPSKNVYGLGENAHDSFRHVMDSSVWPLFSRDEGPVPQAGKQVNLYGVHPFYQCVENDGRAHGVLLLNSNAMDYQLLDHPALTLRTIGGVLDLFLVAGPQPESVVSQYTRLIYRPMLPPYWALGFQLSRYGFATLSDLQAAVNRTRETDIPQDVMYGDIDYMDRRMDFTVDPVSYQGLEDYVSQVKEDGLRFIVILDPAINAQLPASKYPPHSRAMAAGAYITWPEGTNQSVIQDNNDGALGSVMLGYVWPENKTAFPNFFSAAAKKWWTEEIKTFYTEKIKFDGLWIDMNEPANFGTNEGQPWNWPEGRPPWSLACPNTTWDNPPYVTKAAMAGPTHTMADKTLCLAASEAPYRHYDVHSLYGWAQTEPTLRAVQQVTGRRGLVLTRSTFPGSGQWAGHWLGDNRSNWTDMAHSLIGMMEFSLFGIPYIGADICGFFEEAEEEMCERWMEVGAFYPFSRNHNAKGTRDQDPGVWGGSVARSSRRALEIRYRLLPYLYTLFFEAHTRGTTVVRPLLHEFPSDHRTLGVDDQFLWGPAFMISPVLTPATTQRVVYFPQDAWYDYYLGTPVQFPGEAVTIPAPRDTIPLHIRGSHILPTQQPARNTATARRLPMGLIVAIGRDRRATGRLFWDDGESIDTVALKKYSLVKFSFIQHTLTAVVEANSNEDLKGLTLAHLEFLGVERPPSAVVYRGAKVPDSQFTYEAANLRLFVNITHQLNLDFALELRDIWHYEVTMD